MRRRIAKICSILLYMVVLVALLYLQKSRTTWYTTLLMLSVISLTFVVLDYKVVCFISLGALFIHIISLYVYISIYNRKI